MEIPPLGVLLIAAVLYFVFFPGAFMLIQALHHLRIINGKEFNGGIQYGTNGNNSFDLSTCKYRSGKKKPFMHRRM
jgi:hypothetical protein